MQKSFKIGVKMESGETAQSWNSTPYKLNTFFWMNKILIKTALGIPWMHHFGFLIISFKIIFLLFGKSRKPKVDFSSSLPSKNSYSKYAKNIVSFKMHHRQC